MLAGCVSGYIGNGRGTTGVVGTLRPRPVASSEGGGLFSRLRANEGGRGREAPGGGSVIAATGDVVVARWQLLSLPNPHDLIWQDGDRPYSLMASSSGTH